MYTWEDRARAQSEKTQMLTLRPENTAGVVRAYIEHGLGESGQLQKLYYIGPQFRRERPQKGRYRQFSQIGAEVIGPPSSGSESPVRDAEVLETLAISATELSSSAGRARPGTMLAEEPGGMTGAVVAALRWAANEGGEERRSSLVLVLDNIDLVDGVSRTCLWKFLQGEPLPKVVMLLASEERPPSAPHGGTPGSRASRPLARRRGIARQPAPSARDSSPGRDGSPASGAPQTKASARRVEPLYLEQYRRWRGERPKTVLRRASREIVEARLQELEPAPRRVLQARRGRGADHDEPGRGAPRAHRRCRRGDQGARASAGFVVVDSEARSVWSTASTRASRSTTRRRGSSISSTRARRGARFVCGGHRAARLPPAPRPAGPRGVHARREGGAPPRAARGRRGVDCRFVRRLLRVADVRGARRGGRERLARVRPEARDGAPRRGKTDQAKGLLVEVLQTLGPADHARAPVLEELAMIATATGKPGKPSAGGVKRRSSPSHALP